MMIGHTWDSLKKATPYPMFSETRHRGHSASGELHEALTHLAKSIVGYLPPSHVSSSLSAAKTAQL